MDSEWAVQNMDKVDGVYQKVWRENIESKEEYGSSRL